MNFKLFLKKMNRGVALGLAVCLGFAVYIQIDKQQFVKAKPEIEEMIKSYISENCALSVTDESHRSLDVKHTSEELSEIRQKYTDTAEKYWIDSTPTVNWYYSLDDLKSDISSYTRRLNSDTYGYITENKPIVKKVSIKKSGPTTATAEVKYDFVVTSVGSATGFSLSSPFHAGQPLQGLRGEVEYQYADDGYTPMYRYEWDPNYSYLMYVTQYDDDGKALYTEKYDEQGKLVERWEGEKSESEEQMPDFVPEEQTNTYTFSSIIELRLSGGKWRIFTLYDFFEYY